MNKTISGNITIPFPTQDGLHTIQVFGNDSVGTMYQSDIRYFITAYPPVIHIFQPYQFEIFGELPPEFNIAIIDSNFEESWYTLDNGATNISFTGSTGTINQTEWDKYSDGPVIIRFYANDTTGRESFEEVSVVKDISAPIIGIDSPGGGEYFGDIPPNFDISVSDASSYITWYTIDNGINNVTFTGSTGTINQTEWDKYGDLSITIRFYANDTFGNINYNEVVVNKDATDPLITIILPTTGAGFTTIPPEFEVNITEANIDLIWYTIDGGATNYYITQNTGYIDSTAWNNAPIGAITIRFYIQDLAGNLDYDEIIVQKSSPPPPLDINLMIIIAVVLTLIVFGIIGGTYFKRRYVRIKVSKPVVDKTKSFEERKKKQKKTRRAKEVKPQLMNCPFCHGEIKSDQKYCYFCGSKLNE
jgi:hypothetical protein